MVANMLDLNVRISTIFDDCFVEEFCLNQKLVFYIGETGEEYRFLPDKLSKYSQDISHMLLQSGVLQNLYLMPTKDEISNFISKMSNGLIESSSIQKLISMALAANLLRINKRKDDKIQIIAA